MATAALGRQLAHEDLTLARKLANGDHSAFTELYNRSRYPVLRTCSSILKEREDTNEACQQTWLKALEKIPQFKGESKFITWVVRIAVNESLMILRAKRSKLRKNTVSFDAPLPNREDPLFQEIPAGKNCIPSLGRIAVKRTRKRL